MADILCYVRLHTELALRAKALLLMRENGFEVPVDQDVRDKFAEMHFLEGSIGRTGQMAIRPMLHLSRKDLRQFYLLCSAPFPSSIGPLPEPAGLATMAMLTTRELNS